MYAEFAGAYAHLLVGTLALFLNVEAQVLEQEDLGVLALVDGLLRLGANGVGEELDVLAKELAARS